MKEIGEMLREAREKNGVSVTEAAEDLGLRASQIESVEAGNLKAFKDVNYLKQFMRDYAKYLGLDADKIVESFNEFIFDYTSRIPTEKIEEAKKAKARDPKKIASPYTISYSYKDLPPLVAYSIMIVLVLIIGYLLYGIFSNGNFQFGRTNGGVEQYEFSK